jgi:hypothetical protein
MPETVYVLSGSNPLIVASDRDQAEQLGELMGFDVEEVGVRGKDQMDDMLAIYGDDGDEPAIEAIDFE